MKKKTNRRLALLVLLFFSVVLLWYFWRDLARLAGWPAKRAAPEEKISEQDRKKLEEILKQRKQ